LPCRAETHVTIENPKKNILETHKNVNSRVGNGKVCLSFGQMTTAVVFFKHLLQT